MNKSVTTDVIIEADSLDEANNFAESIGIYFDGVREGRDCGCCGDRWYPPHSGDSVPSLYGTPVEQCKSSWYRKEVFVYYKRGYRGTSRMKVVYDLTKNGEEKF